MFLIILFFAVPLSLNSIYEEVIKSEAGRNMTIDRVSASLVQLGSPPFVREFDESYSVGIIQPFFHLNLVWLVLLFSDLQFCVSCTDFKHIIELAQNHEVYFDLYSFE